MNILLVTEFFPSGKDLKYSGGVESRNFFVARELAKRNSITIITSRLDRNPKKEVIDKININRVNPQRNYSATSGNIIQRVRFVKNAIIQGIKTDADIVEGTNFVTHFIAAIISKYKKIPSVAWYPDVWIGSWIKNAGVYGIFGEILERVNLYLGFSVYIAISEVTASKLKSKTKTKVHTIPCAVDHKEFQKKIKKSADPTIICISRLAEYKNIKTLILAFAHISTKVKNVKLIIVGSGPEEKSLKNLSDNLKLKNKIKFYSNLPRKKLINLLKSSHIFSLPSLVEGFGIATIEAGSAKLPYVNSNIPVISEVTKKGKGGYLVDPKDPFSFSKKFQLLLNDKKLYNKKSKESKNLSKLYQWKNIAKQTENVYKSLI